MKKKADSVQLLKLKFPKYKKIILRGFSLYSRLPAVEVSFTDGVFCLTGANGLGKSTFLSAVNYAITGIVADPQRKFESVDEFYRERQKFAAEYFSGRINEKDRKKAEVEIEFVIDTHRYRLRRGIFEAGELRSLSVQHDNGRLLINGERLSASERNAEYMKQVATDVGLSSFPQMAFLQHYILTFDESRLLLFFEPKILEQALYLTFGVDSINAKRAGDLRRDIEKEDSKVRNLQWQATDFRKKINEIEADADSMLSIDDAATDLEEEHRRLSNVANEAEKTYKRIENEVKDTTLKLAEASAAHSAFRAEYSAEFARHIGKKVHVNSHPLIVSSISDQTCGFCGHQGPDIAEKIKQKSVSVQCPLCNSSLSQSQGKDDGHIRLKVIDEKLSNAQIQVDEAVKKLDRLKEEQKPAQEDLILINKKLAEFEDANQKVIEHLRYASNPSDISLLVNKYKETIQERLKKKEEAKLKRDDKKSALKRIEKEFEQQYREAENHFVPIFSDLAWRFLGLSLDIKLEIRSSSGIGLVLELKGSVRRDYHQLSESQRFFIDIALRMAMVQFVSEINNKACLFIDTPEGSLDIAYEKRAGDMLAKFIDNGHDILMTANVNTSRLLIALAESCGKARMALHRMTDWAELSEVQVAEEELFALAYKEIDSSLNSPRGKK